MFDEWNMFQLFWRKVWLWKLFQVRVKRQFNPTPTPSHRSSEQSLKSCLILAQWLSTNDLIKPFWISLWLEQNFFPFPSGLSREWTLQIRKATQILVIFIAGVRPSAHSPTRRQAGRAESISFCDLIFFGKNHHSYRLVLFVYLHATLVTGALVLFVSNLISL